MEHFTKNTYAFYSFRNNTVPKGAHSHVTPLYARNLFRYCVKNTKLLMTKFAVVILYSNKREQMS